MIFVDRVELFVAGGAGGDGCLSFRREKYVPRGGPDGGDGGHGGNVVLRPTPDANSLAGLSSRRHWQAERGTAGAGSNRTGKSGDDLIIEVPPGTIVRDRDHGFVLKDLTEPGVDFIVARGGKGGKGNTAFASATNQAPREFERGQAGESRSVVLELKVIADVGLIGLPNAGKSTLLSRITKATPEIANYPFTTKYPNLGIHWLDEDRNCVVADIPGLIEGAHTGVGLGHEFLRHVERTRVLVHLVECQPIDQSDPVENYHTIRKELELHSPKLAQKPELLFVSKAELTDTSELVERLSKQTGQRVDALSAVTGQGLETLRRRLLEALTDRD